LRLLFWCDGKRTAAEAIHLIEPEQGLMDFDFVGLQDAGQVWVRGFYTGTKPARCSLTTPMLLPDPRLNVVTAGSQINRQPAESVAERKI
jgi:hypothetical protein